MSHRAKVFVAILLGLSVVSVGLGLFFLGRAVHRLPLQITPAAFDAAELVEHEGRVMVKAVPVEGEGFIYVEPGAYLTDVYQERQAMSFGGKLMLKALNISSAATVGWVVLGLLGQILFAGRMVVQWLATEKERRSVVPTSFWWLGLVGATMLGIYFVWRKDAVGILGQAMGWAIYVRNLYFIYGKGRQTATEQGTPADADAPAPETP